MAQDSLEEKLALAPKYGQNQAWLLLNSVLAEDDTGPARPKGKPKPSSIERHSPLKADLKLTEAVKKSLLPNIEVKTRAKIPRGPRINWLNRCIALYLKFIGEDFLGFKTSAGLLQAAVAHELRAFETNPNAQKYHAALTRQPPDLAQVDYDSLSSLCKQYSQPMPEQHPQHAARSTAAPECADASFSTVRHAVSGTHDAVQSQEDAPKGSGTQLSGLGASWRAQHDVIEVSAGVAEHDTGTGGVHLSGSEKANPVVNCTESRKLKRLREGYEEADRASAAVEPYVDALFESDDDVCVPGQATAPDSEQMNAGPVHDSAVEHSTEYGSELSGGAAVAGEEEERGSFLVGTKARREHDSAATASRETGGIVEVPASGVSSVWSEVRDFVGMCLGPWQISGVVNTEQSEVIIDKCVSKVLGAHAGRKDAAFLEAEGERIQGLVAQYADFVVKKSKKQ